MGAQTFTKVYARFLFLGLYLEPDTGVVVGDCARGGFALRSAMLIANVLRLPDLKEVAA